MDRVRILCHAELHAPLPMAPEEADALAWAGDRIVGVGPTEVLRARWPDTEVVDLGGAVVAPGFVDTHLHPLPMCFFESSVDLSATRALDEVLELLADRAAEIDDGEWLFAQQLDDELLAERRLPDRHELDRATGGRPVVVLRRDGHHAIGSTAALRAAGISSTTADPPGGVIHRDAAGELTGLCGETASSLLLDAVPTPPWEQFEQGLERIVARLAGQGITGISAICQTGSEGPAGRAGELESIAWTALIDQVPFDVQSILIGDGAAAAVADLRNGPLHDPDRGRRLDAVKLFLDGTLGGHTACMRQPFSDGGGSGMLTKDLADAYAWVADAHVAGLQICVHAIGDRANAEAVALFRRLRAEHPGGVPVHRVEHASVSDPTTIEAMAELGVAAVVQPVSIRSERAWLAKRLGDRVGRVYPYRAMLDAGVTVAGSSDAPIESTDALDAMRCAVDRLGVAPDQALTPTEALELYTTGAAQVRGTEQRAGRLAEGFDADLVVLSGAPGAVTGVEVRATVARGRVLIADDSLGLEVDGLR
jgi:predicted amidohydrolase YtcJ